MELLKSMLVNKACKVYNDKKWKDATIIRELNNRIVVRSGNALLTVKPDKVWLKKGFKRRFNLRANEVIIGCAYRFRRPIQVVPTYFTPGKTFGDFVKMIDDPVLRKHGVFLFNDNHEQFLAADPRGVLFNNPRTHEAGGGNAAIRPWQQHKHAIGIPTGPYVTLKQLVQDLDCASKPSKYFIQSAFHRVVDLIIDNPDKTTVYYSAEHGTKRLGMGIFNGLVGIDVIYALSMLIQLLPNMVDYKRRHGHLSIHEVICAWKKKNDSPASLLV